MLAAAWRAGSQERDTQDMPAPVKQSLRAAETNVRVTWARALHQFAQKSFLIQI